MSPEWTKHGEEKQFPSLCLNQLKHTHMKSTIHEIALDLTTQKYTLCLSFDDKEVSIKLNTTDAETLLGNIETEIEIDRKKQIVYYIVQG